jgi:hypothetical protein
MMPIYTKAFGAVNQPLTIYDTPQDHHTVECFYRNIIALYDEEDTDHIDCAMIWCDTRHGSEFWSDACYGGWEEFEGSKADRLLRAALAEMFSLPEWSPDLIKELL